MNNIRFFNRLVIAAYRLPFRFIPTKRGFRAMQNSGGLVSAMLALAASNRISDQEMEKIAWVGIDENPSVVQPGKTIQNQYFDIVPVSIPDSLKDLFYGGFCNDLIWPLFHYFPSFTVFDDSYFHGYREANERYCDRIVAMAKPGDFIWIHDYQLMLLPEMLRSRIPDVKIGFFLHIPFPSYEIFRLLPERWRRSLIDGLLGADLVGFHTEDYTRHFLSAVRRVTGLEPFGNMVFGPKKMVKVNTFPIGIDFVKFHEACLHPKVMYEKSKIRTNLSGQKLIFSVDRLDYSKGLLFRLQGFERFLETYPEWKSKVVFNMVVVPSRDTIEKYRQMKQEIESTVGRINGRFSTLAWRPVIYQYKSLSFNDLVARYDASDVGLVTPLRDGMNLVAKEFIACQVQNEGVLILSEMAGAAIEMREALIINPFDTAALADAIFNALEMSPEEKHERIKIMQRRLEESSVFTWARDFFEDASDSFERQKLSSGKAMSPSQFQQIRLDYGNSRQRILFLDYDGTLVPFHSDPLKAVISSKSLDLIDKLARESRNHVVIISGRSSDFLESQFKGLPVILVAEHGFAIRYLDKEWQYSDDQEVAWMTTVLPVLQDCVRRCQGTFIETKRSSLAWHYRNADIALSRIRLAELKDSLIQIQREAPGFELMEGNKVLEVKGHKRNKGWIAEKLREEYKYDFVLAAGDDRTDEYIFERLKEPAITIKVGTGPTRAKYTVADHSEMISLLASLSDTPGDLNLR